MFTIRPLRGGRCHYGTPPSIQKMVKSGASVPELLEARIEKHLENTFTKADFEHQEAFIRVKDHPIKRLILRLQGKSEDSVPVQLKGKIESYLFGKGEVSYEKFNDEITYKDLKEAAYGKTNVSNSESFLNKICQKMNHMKDIGLV